MLNVQPESYSLTFNEEQWTVLQFHRNSELRLNKVEDIQQEELKYLFRQKRFPQTVSAMRFGQVKNAAPKQNMSWVHIREQLY